MLCGGSQAGYSHLWQHWTVQVLLDVKVMIFHIPDTTLFHLILNDIKLAFDLVFFPAKLMNVSRSTFYQICLNRIGSVSYNLTNFVTDPYFVKCSHIGPFLD